MAGNKFFKWIKRVFLRDESLEVERREKDTALKSDKSAADQKELMSDRAVPDSKMGHETAKSSHPAEASAKPGEKPDQDASLSPRRRISTYLPKKGGIKEISKREKKLINIGIDFGTSSTKIIYRDHVAGKAWVRTFSDNPPQYPSVVYPSAMRLTDGKVYFGGSVETSRGGLVLRSFKVCMACQTGRVAGDKCNIYYDSSVHPEPGLFTLPAGSTGIRLSACELGTYYLAHVIGLAKRAVYEKFSKDFDVGITYNMSVPVDYQDHAETNASFQKALFLADSLADMVIDGCDLEQLHRAYVELDNNYKEIPPDEVRRTFVQPESVSAVMSYALSRVADPGLYALVDVGAGTTDVSFFRLADLPDRRLAIYSAKSYTVGGDSIDGAVLKYLAECDAIPDVSQANYTDGVKQQIRILKERVRPKKSISIRTKTGVTKIKYDNFSNLAKPVVEEMFLSYRDAFGKAYEKEKKQSRWESCSIFIIGGCSRVDAVRSKLSQKPSFIIENLRNISLPFPDDLQIDNEEIEARDLYFLLAVAYGLSFHPAEYPRILLPSEISPMAPSQKVREEEKYVPWGPVYPDTK